MDDKDFVFVNKPLSDKEEKECRFSKVPQDKGKAYSGNKKVKVFKDH